MSDLKKIIDKKKELSSIANAPLPEYNLNFNAIIARKEQAARSLSEVIDEYRTEARNHTAIIVVDGEKANEFSEISKSDFGCYHVDGEELYNKVASTISDTYLGLGVNQSLLSIIQGRVEDISLTLGISQLPLMSLRHSDAVTIFNRNDLKNFIKKVVNDQIGVELNSLYITDVASRQAYNDDFSGKTLPVVVTTTDSVLAQQLADESPKRAAKASFLVATGDSALKTPLSLKEVTQKSVEKTFVHIKKTIK